MSNQELIEKFLDNSLQSEDQILFDITYKANSDFRKQVDFYSDLIKGVRFASNEKIREEVRQIHHQILPDLLFENDLRQSLLLRERESIKNEILAAKPTLIEETKASQTKVIRFFSKQALAIAASILLAMLLTVFYINQRNKTLDDAQMILVTKSIENIKQRAQRTGFADQEKMFHELQSKIFNLLESGHKTEALKENQAFFISKSEDYRYDQMQGIIFLKSGEYKKAVRSFQTAVTKGDECISKSMVLILDKSNFELNQKLKQEIKQTEACEQFEWIKQVIDQLN
ncbi:MAG: hypothetical protein ABI844_11915 [Saprospiraceae bacterium]